jgi:alpha-1,3-rhamnosyl/mannosyltransferase
VRFLGPGPGDDLPLLYAAARAIIFPSQYEGFGLPVLEAMASSVPVACSRAPGLTEVAGEAALTFDPTSVTEMADALLRLGTDASVRDRLTRLGTARAAAFSWEKTTLLTLRAYRKVVEQA